MQNYVKMYFGQGVGNFYSLDADENTLRGLFILQSTDKEQKKIKNGYWKAMAPVSCSMEVADDGLFVSFREEENLCRSQTFCYFAL